jgi:hypothetical protein
MFTAMRIALSQQRAFAHSRWLGAAASGYRRDYLTRCGVITRP